MSRRYSSCRSLMSPNIRSSSTSEKPITALSGVRSSCDMLARNSDLCRLATSSSRGLRLQLAEQPGVDDGQRRLAGEGLQQLEHVVRRRRRSSRGGPPARRRSGRRAASGTASIDRQPSSYSTARCGSRSTLARSGTSTAPVERRPADQRRVELDRDRPQPLRAAPGCCRTRPRTENEPSRLVVLHDRPAVGAGEPHGVA